MLQNFHFSDLTSFQDDSMTEEAIKQAEEELKSQSPTKLKRTQIARLNIYCSILLSFWTIYCSPNKTESKPAENGKGKENEPAAKKTETSASKDDMAVRLLELSHVTLSHSYQLSGED